MTDAEFIDEQVPAEFVCPLGMCIMDDPVVAADGYSYQRKDIINLFEASHGGVVLSPVTLEAFSSSGVVPNKILKILITSWKRDNPWLSSLSPDGYGTDGAERASTQVSKGLWKSTYEIFWKLLKFWTYIPLWPSSSENSSGTGSTETRYIVKRVVIRSASTEVAIEANSISSEQTNTSQDKNVIASQAANEKNEKNLGSMTDVKKPLMDAIAQFTAESQTAIRSKQQEKQNKPVTSNDSTSVHVTESQASHGSKELDNDSKLQSQAAARTLSQINSLLTKQNVQIQQNPQRLSKSDLQKMGLEVRPLDPVPAQIPVMQPAQPAGLMLLHALQSKNSTFGNQNRSNANPFQRDSSSGSTVLPSDSPLGGNGSSSSVEKKSPLLWITDYDMSSRLENKATHTANDTHDILLTYTLYFPARIGHLFYGEKKERLDMLLKQCNCSTLLRYNSSGSDIIEIRTGNDRYQYPGSLIISGGMGDMSKVVSILDVELRDMLRDIPPFRDSAITHRTHIAQPTHTAAHTTPATATSATTPPGLATPTAINEGIRVMNDDNEIWEEPCTDGSQDFNLIKKKGKAPPVERKMGETHPQDSSKSQSQQSQQSQGHKAPPPLSKKTVKARGNPIVEAVIEVPARTTGYIVGKQGATLVSIKATTGAQLSILQPRKKGKSEDGDNMKGSSDKGSVGGVSADDSRKGDEKGSDEGMKKGSDEGIEGKEGKDEPTRFLVTGTADSVNTALNDLTRSLAKIKAELVVISMTTKTK